MILYGAGELGKLAHQFLDFYNIEHIVCDDNPENYMHDSFWVGKPIFKLSNLSIDLLNTSLLVCISTASYNTIRQKLNNKGFTNVKPFFQVAEEINKANAYKHPCTNGWKIKNHSEYTYDVIESSFKDTYSKYAYAQFFDWHNDYTEFINNDFPINCNDRYFIPEVLDVLHDNEVFIDVGAYDGRVTKKFIEIVRGKYEHIHMFEPTDSMCVSYEKIYKYNYALGDTEDKFINFNKEQGYLCKVDKLSKEKVGILRLDNLELTPTFIKYHLEGYELKAIKGSIKTIKKHRPIITVTTYHTEEGLYKLPMHLIKNLKDYNFYWRNHNYQGQGAVMYCIPKERWSISFSTTIHVNDNWQVYQDLKKWAGL